MLKAYLDVLPFFSPGCVGQVYWTTPYCFDLFC